MENTQFTMLGMTGSGKTCYLLGMYTKMLGALKGFSLTTDDDTDVDLRRRYDKMCDSTLGFERFPAGTDQIDTFKFTLEHAYSPIMSFDWIDYPGGMLDQKNEVGEEYKKLEEYIRNSRSLFICADGALLQGDDDNEDKADLLRYNCGRFINPFLSRYLKNNNYLPPTAIVITKSDLCMDIIKPDDLKEIVEEAFSPLFDKSNDTNRFITIIPVSIGNNISENGYKGKLAPKLIQLPIFMGVWFALTFSVIEIYEEIQAAQKYHASITIERDEEASAFFLWRDKDKIRRLDNLAKSVSDELYQKIQLYHKSMNDANRLKDDLENKVPLVYFNGVQYGSFEEAANKYIGTRYNINL